MKLEEEEEIKKKARQEVVDFVRFLITHLDSQYGIIKKLEASPDWNSRLKEWGIK